MFRIITSLSLIAGTMIAAAPARAQDSTQADEGTRAVRIIEGTAGQPAPAPPPQAVPLSPQVPLVDVRQTSIRGENPAGLELTLLPDVELSVGTKATVRIATKKQGYLILVDVDPGGKLTQIYPNRHTLERRDNQESLNLIKPGQAVTIPNPANPYAGFEFVVAPPAGIAMLVAILSDRPVHLIDLPDVAPPGTGQPSFDQISEVARRLRIAREGGPDSLQQPQWSFDAKLYRVK